MDRREGRFHHGLAAYRVCGLDSLHLFLQALGLLLAPALLLAVRRRVAVVRAAKGQGEGMRGGRVAMRRRLLRQCRHWAWALCVVLSARAGVCVCVCVCVCATFRVAVVSRAVLLARRPSQRKERRKAALHATNNKQQGLRAALLSGRVDRALHRLGYTAAGAWPTRGKRRNPSTTVHAQRSGRRTAARQESQ